MSTLTHTRSSDPITSALAEVETKEQRASMTARVAAAVRLHPGLTVSEIARLLDVHRSVVSKRTTDAERAGQIHRGDPVRVGVRAELTWWEGPAPVVEPEPVPTEAKQGEFPL